MICFNFSNGLDFFLFAFLFWGWFMYMVHILKEVINKK